MREGIGVTLVILAWLAASVLWYFWLSQTIWGFLAGLLVIVAVPAWAYYARD
jgi:hypothetical protein